MVKEISAPTQEAPLYLAKRISRLCFCPLSLIYYLAHPHQSYSELAHHRYRQLCYVFEFASMASNTTCSLLSLVCVGEILSPFTPLPCIVGTCLRDFNFSCHTLFLDKWSWCIVGAKYHLHFWNKPWLVVQSQMICVFDAKQFLHFRCRIFI